MSDLSYNTLMTPIGRAFHGALFTSLLSILVFFLKVICPLNVGCLADPFLIVLFYPLTIFEKLGITNLVPYAYEPLFILLFWGFFGFIIGWIGAQVFPKGFLNEESEEDLEDKQGHL